MHGNNQVLALGHKRCSKRCTNRCDHTVLQNWTPQVCEETRIDHCIVMLEYSKCTSQQAQVV